MAHLLEVADDLLARAAERPVADEIGEKRDRHVLWVQVPDVDRDMASSGPSARPRTPAVMRVRGHETATAVRPPGVSIHTVWCERTSLGRLIPPPPGIDRRIALPGVRSTAP
jgi:hypothetical protein